MFGGAGLALQAVAGSAHWLGMVLAAVIASSLLAQRSLHEHVARVAEALETRGLAAGRTRWPRSSAAIPTRLDEAGVARAAIESLAENFADGVVAPAFWLGVGGLPAGWPTRRSTPPTA